MTDDHHTLERLDTKIAQRHLERHTPPQPQSTGKRERRSPHFIAGITLVVCFVAVAWVAYRLGEEAGQQDPSANASIDLLYAGRVPAERPASPIEENAPYPSLRFADGQPNAPAAETHTRSEPRNAAPGQQQTDLLANEVPLFQPGEVAIQVASRPTEGEAFAYLEQFRAEYSNILEGRIAYLQRRDLEERGIWHRIRIGPFLSEREANSVCVQIEAGGGDCLVVP